MFDVDSGMHLAHHGDSVIAASLMISAVGSAYFVAAALFVAGRTLLNLVSCILMSNNQFASAAERGHTHRTDFPAAAFVGLCCSFDAFYGGLLAATQWRMTSSAPQEMVTL